MSTEIIYLGRDNSIVLVLKSGGVGVDLSGVTKITVAFGATLIESANPVSGIITWAQEGYETGEIRLNLGDQSISQGIYNVPIVIFDVANPDGFVWGMALIRIQADAGATQSFLTVYDLKLELGLDLNNREQDARLALMAGMVQDLWDNLTGRKWASQAYTEIQSIPDNIMTRLFLKNYPVSNLESIKIDGNREWDDDIELLDAGLYSFDPETGIIYLDIFLPEGSRTVQVKYTAGYGYDDLPASIKQLMIRQACYWYKQAKTASYNTTNSSQPGGGSVSQGLNMLKDGLLPEFSAAAARHRRFSI
ncbi:MAG: hypothetical protein JRG97_13320 [Deltaproteobacteria bacterium]|nr:hypothetical protein [Deltaproteobacteria bacterium]MBW2052925.1 hypothetical protein [Deltaproteobacteria bacterium]MBW2142026.1 hypothetical protein [Deltaproteobacteria bacterium]MBW2324437.1 hypothetical protein [Deltaproteobacteria bacterium]